MKRIVNVAGRLLCFSFLLASLPVCAQWAAGNLVVLQVGDSLTALTSAAAPVFLQEYYVTVPAQQQPVHSMALPTVGPARLTISGSANTEGLMSLSTDSAHLVIAGYDAAPGTVAVNGTTASNVNRVVDTVNAQSVGGRSVTSLAFSTTNFRAATKGAGAKYWGGGGSSGVYFLGTASAAGGLGTTATNVRFLQAQNGNIYYTSGASSSLGLNRITGQPVSSGNGGTLLFSSGSSSLYGFAVNAAETVAYLCDDRTGAAGGIYKWTNTAGTWTLADTLITGTGTGAGARSVAVDWSGLYPVLYAVTKDNRLVRLVDSSSAPGVANAYVTLATAPSNAAFRSVCFVPKGACPAAVVTYTGLPSFCTGDSLQLRTAGGGGQSFQWIRNDTVIAGATDSFYFAAAAGRYAVEVTGGACVVVSPPVNVGRRAVPQPVADYSSGQLRVLAAGSYSAFQWLRNAVAIAGATDSVLVPAQDGIYTVEVVQNGCRGISAPVAVSDVGIEQVGPAGELRLFPNPVTEMLAVLPAGSYSFFITNVSGRVVLQGTSSLKGGLNIASLQSGLYFCTVWKVAGNERKTFRFLKQD